MLMPNIIFIIAIILIIIIAIILIFIKKNNKSKVSLTGSKNKFSLSVLFNTSAINEEFFANLENILIKADAGVETTKDIILKLRETIEKNNIKEPTEAKNRLREILISKFIQKKLELKEKNILFIVGVNGVGKTTTIAKLSNLLKKEHNIIIAASDTFRAAAI